MTDCSNRCTCRFCSFSLGEKAGVRAGAVDGENGGEPSVYLGLMLSFLMLLGGCFSRPGLAPAGDPLSREKVGKAPALLSASLRLRLRATCVTRHLLRCGPTRCAPVALRSDKRPQARSRSGCVLRHSHPQQVPGDAGADKKGEQPSGHCCARPGMRFAASRLAFHRSSRRLSVFPLVAAPAARSPGCGQRCRRTALHRGLTCARLFERSAFGTQRVGAHRSLEGVTQVCPERSAGTQTAGGVFLGYFLARARKCLGRRAETRLRKEISQQNREKERIPKVNRWFHPIFILKK